MYREWAAESGLRGVVRCVWRHQSVRPRAFTVVPDGCLDILWTGHELLIAGPDTGPVREPRIQSVHGVRFEIGQAPQLLGVPASALCDARAPLSALWGEQALRLEDALARGDDPHAVLQRALLARRPRPEPLVQALIGMLRATDPRVPKIARALGLSERQLLRRTTAAVGYGPKLLARVLRMQAVVAALERQPQRNLAALAAELGFADQAHLNHEAAELHDTTPTQLRARAQDVRNSQAPRAAVGPTSRHA